jgi:hypothetical protein
MTCVKTDFFNKSGTFLLLLSTSVISITVDVLWRKKKLNHKLKSKQI